MNVAVSVQAQERGSSNSVGGSEVGVGLSSECLGDYVLIFGIVEEEL